MTTPAFTIEEVHDLDAVWPEVEALLEESHRFYMPMVGYGPPEDWRAEIQARFRPGTGALLLLARSSGQAVAFANAMVRNNPGSPPQRLVYLDNVFVREDMRRRGIGQEILSRVESWAAQEGIDMLRLDVFANNDLGVDFWRRRGFAVRAYSMSKEVGTP